MSVRIPRGDIRSPRRHHDDCPEGRCRWRPRHLPLVVYTHRPRDFFRARYWVRCWACDLCDGPYEIPAMAQYERERIESS